MQSPVIDVCIPTYNPKPEHLKAALESLKNQTFSRFDVLISDDASPNGETREIVSPFLSDDRARFRISTERRGIGGNWNACMKQGNAPFVAYLFQDDLWEPTYLETALTVLNEHPSVGFVSLGHSYAVEGTVKTAPQYKELEEFRKREVAPGLHRGREFLKWWTLQELHPNVIGEPSFVVIRRSAMTAVGPFLEDMPQFLDVEYWTRLLTVSDWYNHTENLGSFRVHAAGTSAVNQQEGKGLFDRLRCFERLIRILDGKDKRAAIAARNKSVDQMVGKFFSRVRGGKKIAAQGSGTLRKFCIRHPVLIGKSMLTHMFRVIRGKE